jgi:hypothetical protein
VLFVGMNPGTAVVNEVPRYSALGRLFEWGTILGLRHFGFINVFDRPGAFRPSQVDVDFLRAAFDIHSGPIIVLGNVASTVLKRLEVEHFVLPHPSYRNRKLNDRDFEKRILEECRRWISGRGLRG